MQIPPGLAWACTRAAMLTPFHGFNGTAEKNHQPVARRFDDGTRVFRAELPHRREVSLQQFQHAPSSASARELKPATAVNKMAAKRRWSVAGREGSVDMDPRVIVEDG